MNLKSKIDEVKKYSKASPVLVTGLPADIFGNSTIIKGSIPSKDLGIINTADGLQYPHWFIELSKKESHQLVIENIDEITKESQEKFYEILKYKTISSVDLPKNCRIIVTAQDLKNVSESIMRLCLIIK